MFFLPEEGRAYTYPFLFDKLNIQARYIGLRVVGATNLVCSDELAVIKGDASGANRELEQFPRMDFVMQGIYVAPYLPLLAISTNIITPNWFFVTDMRQAEQRNSPLRYVFDLPSAVEFLRSSAGEVVKDDSGDAGVGLNRWIVKKVRERADGEIGPFYFRVRDGALCLSIRWPDFPSCARASNRAWSRCPYVLWRFRKSGSPTLKSVRCWIDESHAMDWPGFFEAWDHMGFNAVNAFPRYWPESPPKKNLAFLEDARKHGMTVCYQDSPFHVMMSRHPQGDGNLFATSQRTFPQFLPVLSRAMVPGRDSEDCRRLGQDTRGLRVPGH